jgi:predicted RNase H-like HicB family nuclease
MAHYIGVFLPLESGGWRALVPDVPDCEAEAASLDIAVLHIATALAHAAVGLNGAIRPARDLAAIKADGDWVTAHGINWSLAIITMIPVQVENMP